MKKWATGTFQLAEIDGRGVARGPGGTIMGWWKWVLIAALLVGLVFSVGRRQRWEYHHVVLAAESPAFVEDRLNAYGDDGWELAWATRSAGDSLTCVFKRPK